MARLIYFITLILLLGASRGQAFHIVGGELFYDCLGSNDYRITLKLYRDCAAQGSNVAPYGDPEHIAVFDNSGNVVRQIPIPFPGSDTLERFTVITVSSFHPMYV